MNAAVNLQLRYAPFIKAARKMINEGAIGELNDIEVNINVHTPWYTWDFLLKSPRVEILYHSIHYIDLIRSFLGNPESVYAKTTKHPAMKNMAPVRSNIIMDYGEMIRANILTNHSHVYGRRHQTSFIKWEGSKGAIKISFGVLKNYPQGEPDKFEYVVTENGKFTDWRTKFIEGSWFPHAFIGSMEQVMLAATGKIAKPDNSVEDCIFTMACVEAAFGELGVFVIGAGGIVNTAHLPAYQMAGFQVKGIYDLDFNKATDTAGKFGIPYAFKSIEEMLDHVPSNAVF